MNLIKRELKVIVEDEELIDLVKQNLIKRELKGICA